ncbi:MAG: hypothetical protein KF726_01670 [Anaerolineae bacterium]|nr:hypothetical protein [Anaerolineae bacterium]
MLTTWMRRVTGEGDYMIYAIILFVFIVMVIGAARARRTRLRPVDAFRMILKSADEAMETGKGVHVSFGGSALRDSSAIAAIATSDILYFVAARTMVADRPVLSTLSDPMTLALAQDILRKAYASRSRLVQYQDTQARWYPQGEQSLAFAAGAGLAARDYNAGTNILTGRFGAEMMLLAEHAIRQNRTVIAQSDRIDGQAVAYAISETPFIGEELYASSAYLTGDAASIGTVVAQDILRYAVVIALIAFAIMTFLGIVVL